MAVYIPTPGFKGRTFKLCVLSPDGTFISASAAPHCGVKNKDMTWALVFSTKKPNISLRLQGLTGAKMSRTLASFCFCFTKTNSKKRRCLLPPAFLKPIIEKLWVNQQLRRNGKTVETLQKHPQPWKTFLPFGTEKKNHRGNYGCCKTLILLPVWTDRLFRRKPFSLWEWWPRRRSARSQPSVSRNGGWGERLTWACSLPPDSETLVSTQTRFSLRKNTSISSAKLLSWKSDVLVLFATTSLMMPPKFLLFLSHSHALTIATRQTSESPKLCSPSCTPCTSTCSHHSSTQTSPSVACQSPNYL